MKRLTTWMAATVLTMGAMLLMPQPKAQAQGVSVSFQMFYDQLAPYGQWIDDPQYGYVWAPDAGNDFRPYYSGGHWVMTEYGNTWVSDYSWGWAPFHYGRWTYDNYYGWVWIPGDQWGPAWVNWRSGGGYYGWAPLGPGISINVSVGNYYTPYDWWTFIPCRYIYHNGYNNYWRGSRYNNSIFNQTTVINNYYNNRYVYGPRRSDVQQHVGRVNVYQIRNDNRPGRTSVNRNQVNIYRPEVTRISTTRRDAPRNAVRTERAINNPVRMESRDMRINDGRQNNVRQERFDRQQNMQNRQREAEQSQRQQEERGRIEESRRMQQEAQQRNIREQQLRQQQEQRQIEQRRQIDAQRAVREEQMRQEQERARMQNEQRMQADRQRMEVEQRQRMQQDRARQEQEARMQQERARRTQEMQQRQQREQPRQEWRRPDQQRMQHSTEQRGQPAERNARPFGRGR